jgi:hypothetical protein
MAAPPPTVWTGVALDVTGLIDTPVVEVHMSDSSTKGSGISLLDGALIVAGIVGGILVVLWVVRAIAGVVLFAFKLAILVVVVAVAIRLIHLFTRNR